MNSKEIQENVVKAVENCGLAIYKNAPKIVGNYQYQTGRLLFLLSLMEILRDQLQQLRCKTNF